MMGSSANMSSRHIAQMWSGKVGAIIEGLTKPNTGVFELIAANNHVFTREIVTAVINSAR